MDGSSRSSRSFAMHTYQQVTGMIKRTSCEVSGRDESQQVMRHQGEKETSVASTADHAVGFADQSLYSRGVMTIFSVHRH